MKLNERIAKAIAPEAVTLTTEFTARLRAAHDAFKRECEFLRRENKRLRKTIQELRRRG